MNGRLLDPKLGRVISADPLVPDPLYSQSYNRFSYVYNNPLKYTDPSGYTPCDWFRRVCDIFEGMREFSETHGRSCPPASCRSGFDAWHDAPAGSEPYLDAIAWYMAQQMAEQPAQAPPVGVPVQEHTRDQTDQEGTKPLTYPSPLQRRPTIDEALEATRAHIRELDASLAQTQEMYARFDAEWESLEEATSWRHSVADLLDATANALTAADLLLAGPTGEGILPAAILKGGARRLVEGGAARALPSPRTWLLDNATDQTLRNRIHMLYRPKARIGNGGTADAVRYELQTGQLLSPKGHFEKAILERDGLLRDLASGRLNETDTRIARQLLSDLQHALQGQ